MDEAVWQRHANPWSVYTRYSGLPLLTAALWSRVWIDWWSLFAIAAAIGWIWLNPRVFPPPMSTDNWASQAVLGERIWLNRQTVPVPIGHARAAVRLLCLSGLGSLLWAYGVWVLDPEVTLSGMAGTTIAKSCFLDRMVWLYQDARAQDGARIQLRDHWLNEGSDQSGSVTGSGGTGSQ